jgi:hypothetical protein
MNPLGATLIGLAVALMVSIPAALLIVWLLRAQQERRK